jgi:hypothetical protein
MVLASEGGKIFIFRFFSKATFERSIAANFRQNGLKVFGGAAEKTIVFRELGCLTFENDRKVANQLSESPFNITRMYVSGLPDGFFSNQKSQLGKFWRVLQWKMFVYFMAI